MRDEPGTVALVESNTTGGGRSLVSSLRRHGLNPVLLTADESRYPYVRELSVRTLHVDTSSRSEVERVLPGFTDLRGVATTSEHYLEITARAAHGLGLACADPSAVAACRHKGRQRHVLASAGIDIPEGIALAPGQAGAATDAARGLGGVVVVKPVSGSGSFGVRLCSSPAEAEEHVRHLFALEGNERGVPQPTGVVVEEFVRGPEYSVELLSDRVLAVIGKHVTGPPSFIETGHDLPARVSPEETRALTETARSATKALGVGGFGAHVELRMRDGVPVVIEVNPRVAGGGIPLLLEHALGLDVFDTLAELVLGGDPTPSPRYGRGASIRHVKATGPGRVSAVRGVDAARKVPRVVDVRVPVVAGTFLPEAHGDFRDRCGWVLAADDEPETAVKAAEEAHALIRVLVENGGRQS